MAQDKERGKKYQIIYADPPWRYGGRTGIKNDPKHKNLEEVYPTLDFNYLKYLDVNSLADKDCLLFLWVVSPEIKRCIEIGENWGFKYITVAFVWHSPPNLFRICISFPLPWPSVCFLR